MTVFYRIKRLWTLEAFKPDVPLSRDEASRFLPWIIALMVYLAALTLAGGFTLHRTVTASHAAQVASFSVHLPRTGDRGEAATAKALALLRATPGVTEVNVLAPERLRAMVEPWFGRGSGLNSLPLPVVIEGRLAPGASLDADGLRARLATVAPGADVDDHKQWLAQFSALVDLVQWILLAVAFFIIAATAAVVIFACKTSLKIHRATINLLHRLGAMDGYIAEQFQQHAALLALKGAFVGSGFASGTLLALHLMARRLDSPLFPSFALTFSHWTILVSLPIVMSLLALLSARLSVLAALHRMP